MLSSDYCEKFAECWRFPKKREAEVLAAFDTIKKAMTDFPSFAEMMHCVFAIQLRDCDHDDELNLRWVSNCDADDLMQRVFDVDMKDYMAKLFPEQYEATDGNQDTTTVK